MSSSKGQDDPLHVSRQAENKIAFRLMALAEKHCQDLIEAYNRCASGRSVSMIWACKPDYNASQDCLHNYLNEENLNTVKRRWKEMGQPRMPDWSVLLAGMDVPPKPTSQ
ncbi:hypothetical protein DUNSADRAFT_13401 [Dunaliella salina]|uniref:COX assembly mitochondrial protein n=1 Tax=Dunaliella salina TaxID=3046 RepID=A0ABQ7H3D0_DUNSA|nr:hypothetical protein DUNSADRAFT_13401 [Dunaliella salina]|eukprot:KAF5841325.1 hypothetical protein DUNSADRAFT_13401 [Dunaliella salina]